MTRNNYSVFGSQTPGQIALEGLSSMAKRREVLKLGLSVTC